jgi:hypothetical protein
MMPTKYFYVTKELSTTVNEQGFRITEEYDIAEIKKELKQFVVVEEQVELSEGKVFLVLKCKKIPERKERNIFSEPLVKTYPVNY